MIRFSSIQHTLNQSGEMPPRPTMSIAATLAAHKKKASILNKYQPIGQAGPATDVGGSAGNTANISNSTTNSPEQTVAPPKRPLYTSSSQAPPTPPAKKPKPSATTTTPQSLPIHLDQVISDATGSQINACQYNTTGEYILTGGVDRTVRLWNPDTKFCIKSYEAHGWEVLDLAVSPENGKFASCGGDRTVFLWDVISGMTIRRFTGHTQVYGVFS